MGILIPWEKKQKSHKTPKDKDSSYKRIAMHLPQSFPVNAIHARAERLSTAAFKWLKKSDLLPSVNEEAFMITSFNGFRNSASPAGSGFCKMDDDMSGYTLQRTSKL